MVSDGASPAYLQPGASVAWQTPLTPSSRRHRDIYWSPNSAVAEKTHVFIKGNRLRERWTDPDSAHFTLCEVGFGFGVSCLATTNLWRRMKPRGGILNYIAFEKSPVLPEDMAALYARLAPEAGFDDRKVFGEHLGRLLEQYPQPSPGHHLLWLDHDICLDLVFGDVNDTLPTTTVEADAWYLDGFSPSSNPDAWRPAMFRKLAACSRPGATLATYSVAGEVRRGLSEAGFSIAREPGFGNKAEMLTGTAPGNWQPRPRWHGRVAIIGAGIAGLNCARALARRGIRSEVFEAAGVAFSGASSIPALALSPRLAVRPDGVSVFSLSAFQYATREDGIVATGNCRLATTARDEARHERIAACFPREFCQLLSPRDASERIGADTDLPGLWFETAGWCAPGVQFVDTSAICSLRTRTEIIGIETGAAGVRLHTRNGDRTEFDRVIIATGAHQLTPTARLPLVPLRGQSISARLARTRIRCVVSGPLSLIPADDLVIAGATYALDDADSSIRVSDTTSLIRRLHGFTGDRATVTGEYAGVRCTTRDRTPVVGGLPDARSLTRDADSSAPPSFMKGLYVCTGFGYHGASHAPLCAEYLARTITGEPDGIGMAWRRLLDPARRALRRPLATSS